MQRIPIGLGVHSNRSDSKFAARSNDAEGDFTTICDEDFLEQINSFSEGSELWGGE